MSSPKSAGSWQRVAGLLALAAAVHVAAVWALPRLIMARLAATASAAEKSGTYLPPMTDHTQRRIVMPSPDLLYATCAFDVGERPLSIRVDPRGAGHQGYWSIALYASNSDNFHVLNDRQAGDAPVHLVLRSAAPAGTAAIPGEASVTSPSRRGLLLMRLLVGDPARDLAAAEAARRTLRCEPT